MRLCYATEIGTRAIPRRFSLRSKTVLCCAVLAISADSALSQSYPIRPLRIIVASSPSSAADVVARILAQHLSDDLGQQVIVENRAGAGGNIGAKIAAGAAADGYTVFLATPAHVISSGLSRKPGYDLAADFAPISQVSSGMYVIVVNPSVAVQSINGLVALAKSKPGRLNYASGGIGNATHLAVELFKSMAGIDMVHLPYQGAGPAMVALIAGESQLAFANLTAALPHIASGKLVALAVTGPNRSRLLPRLPTVAESGVPGYVVTAWFGVVAPKGVPKEAISKLNSGIVRGLLSPRIKALLEKEGAEPVGSTAADFAAFIQSEATKWAQAIRKSGVSIE